LGTAAQGCNLSPSTAIFHPESENGFGFAFYSPDDADLAAAVRVGVNQSDYSLTDYSE
jgi:hypothetical protein